MDEYELLRAEMLNAYDAITQYNCVLYTAVAAILAFAVERGNYALCMVPLFLILPIQVLCRDRYDTMCKQGAYMNVFLEGERYHWERRQSLRIASYEVPSLRRTQKLLEGTHYYFASMLCWACSVYFLCHGEYAQSGRISRIMFVTLVTLIALGIIRWDTVDFPATRERYIQQWREVQRAEESRDLTDERSTGTISRTMDDGDIH